MAYTVTINTIPVNIYNLSITQTIDQSLDFGFMELRNNKAESYNVGDYVRIVVDGETLDFMIEADVVQKLNTKTYKHRISLIELTKRLENYTDGRRKFTQPTDPNNKKSLYEVAEIIRMTVPVEFQDFANVTRLFRFSQNVIDRLSAIEAPEFQFENKNLKEMMNDIFEFANGIPRLKIENIFGRDTFVLDGDFYNELKNKIAEFNSGQFANQKQININESASGFDSETANQVGEVVYEPSKRDSDYKQLVSPGGLLDTDSAVMATEFGIVEIQKVEVFVEYTDFNQVRAKRPVDISFFILEKEEYDLLPTFSGVFENRYATAGSQGLEKLLTKSNTLFFTRYQKNIGSLYEPYGFFIASNTNIENVLYDAVILQEYETNNPDNVSFLTYAGIMLQRMDLNFDVSVQALADSRLKNLQFRVEYIPYYTSRNVVRKQSTQKTNREMLRYYGQSDKVTSPVRALKRLFKTVQQMGNDQVQTSSRNTSYGLGDYSEEGYILVTKEIFFNNDSATAKYLWSKNYQQISQFIGMNAEPRVFEIPLQAYKRNIVMEHFVELSEVNRDNDSLFSDFFVNRFMRTMALSGTRGSGIHSVAFNNPYLYDPTRTLDEFYYFVDPENSDEVSFRFESLNDIRILKPLAVSAGGNTISYYFEFDSAKAAMSRQNRSDAFAKILMDIIPYTDEKGELDTYSFQLLERFFLPDARNYPLIKTYDLQKAFNVFDQRVLAYLDSAEILAQTFQLHVIPEYGKENKFIVGKYLIEHNALWNPEAIDSDGFEIVAREKPYTWTDEYDFNSPVRTNMTYGILGNRFSLTVPQSGFPIFVSDQNNNQVIGNWALIRKSTKQIVFAVNDGYTSTVYFNFRRKRTGFVYEFENPVYEGLTILKTPFQLTAIVLGQTSVYMGWNWYPNDPADEFIVEYSQDEETWIVDSTTDFNYTFTGLVPGTEYAFRVKAKQGSDFSLYATTYATTQDSAPEAPTNLTASASSQTAIAIFWEDNSTNEYAFIVEASESSTMSPTLKTDGVPIDRESYSFTGLTPNTTYYFRVRAIGNGGTSGFSNIASATTLAPDKVSTPTISGLSASTNSVNFTVTNTYNQLVTIKANLTTTPPSTVITTNLPPGATFNHTISGLSQGTGYTLFVRAEATGATVSDVAQQSFTTQTLVSPPPAPSTISFPIIEDTSARVQWNQVTQADGYRGELFNLTTNESGIGFVKGSNMVVIHDYTTNQLIPGNQYRVRVWSTKSDGQGGTLESTTFVQGTFTTTQTLPYPAAPSNVQITRSGTNNTVTWQDNSNNETGFFVTYAFQGQFDQEPQSDDYFPIHDTQAPNVTSYIHSTFSGQGTHYYRIYSYNQNGNSTTFAQGSIFVQQ